LDLVVNIKNLLVANTGRCVIISPPRGNTMDLFLGICKQEGLTVESIEENFLKEIIGADNTEDIGIDIEKNIGLSNNFNDEKTKVVYDESREKYQIFKIILSYNVNTSN
jgi:hypothetical protein